MCLSASGNYTHVEILAGRNSSGIPPAGIEPTPVRCRCTALTTKPGTDFHILFGGGGGVEKYFGGGGAFSSKSIQLRLNSIYNREFRYN